MAVDGMAITAISKSQAIAGYVQQKGYKMPKSSTTIYSVSTDFIKKNVLNFGKILKNKKMQSVNLQLQWTNGQTILHYVNVTAHVFGIDSNAIECYVLGLTEIIKQANTETIKHLVEAKLDFLKK